MRIFGLSLAIIVTLITLLVLFRRPLLAVTGAECLQLTGSLYHRAMIDLNTGRQIGTLGSNENAGYTYTNLSPDQNGIAYFGEQHDNNQALGDHRYQLVVRQANVINNHKSFVFNSETYNSLAVWAPNSRILAYVWEADYGLVYIMLVDKISGEIGRKKLFDVDSDEDVVTFNGWSADSKYLSISYRIITSERTYNTTLVISIPDLSTVKTINNAPAIGQYPFATAGWSASGHWLALQDITTNSPMLISPDNDQPIVDHFPDNGQYWWQGWWSSDGEHLAVISSHGARIDVLGIDGQIDQQITDRADNIDLDLDYNADTHLFPFRQYQPPDTFGYAGDGGAGLPPNIYWSPDRSVLIFTENPNSESNDNPDELNLVVYNHNTRKKEVIVRKLITNPQITPDKNYLFYTRSEDSKYIVEILNTTSLQRTTIQPDEDDRFGLRTSGLYGWYNSHNETLLLWDTHWVSFIERGVVRARYKSPSINDMWSDSIQTDDSQHVILFETTPNEPHVVLAMNIYDLESATENRIILPQSVVFSESPAASVSADHSLIALAFMDRSYTTKLVVMNRQGEVVKWIERNDLNAVTELAFGSCDNH